MKKPTLEELIRAAETLGVDLPYHLIRNAR